MRLNQKIARKDETITLLKNVFSNASINYKNEIISLNELNKTISKSIQTFKNKVKLFFKTIHELLMCIR